MGDGREEWMIEISSRGLGKENQYGGLCSKGLLDIVETCVDKGIAKGVKRGGYSHESMGKGHSGSGGLQKVRSTREGAHAQS